MEIVLHGKEIQKRIRTRYWLRIDELIHQMIKEERIKYLTENFGDEMGRIHVHIKDDANLAKDEYLSNAILTSVRRHSDSFDYKYCKAG